MKNHLCCLVGFALIIGQIALSLNADIKKENKQFFDTLDSNQRIIYDKVVKERMNIYICATIISLIIGNIFLFVNRNKNNMFKACCFITIVFLIQYFYYILHPKKLSMVEHLNSKRQLKEWNDVYKIYQRNYHYGMLFAIFGYFLFGYGF